MFSISMIWLADRNDTAQVPENVRHFSAVHMQIRRRILARPQKTCINAAS